MISFQIIDGRDRAVTGNQFRVRRNRFDQFGKIIRQAFDAPAAVQINERKASGKEIIAEMDDVRRGKKQNRVAVGMPARVMNGANFFAVKMN